MSHQARKPATLPSGHDPEFSRRALLAAAGALGLVGVAGPAARAQAKPFAGKTVTFASWGGSFQDAQKVAYCDPFAAASGATVVQAGPVDFAKFRTMVQSGQPVWDVVDVTIEFLYNGAKDGLFEKIDKSAVHLNRIDPLYVHDHGVGDIVWSYNIAYSTKAFSADNHPRSWADVFDVKRFPGTRTLRDRVAPMMEIALMADGVPSDKLYPIDADRAFKKLDTIKKNTIFWETNSQSQQLFTDGEVTCGLILNGRAYDAIKKGAKIAVEWNQNIQSVDYLVVPKGSKRLEIAMALIDSMTIAENQAKVANLIAYSPTNPKAFANIDKEVAPWLSTNPDNAQQGFIINAEYWRDNLQKLQERWESWKLS